MTVADAQHEMRTALMGGFMGQLVSGILWLSSAAFATWGTTTWAIGLLLAGGFFIYPLTLLGLKVMRHDTRVSPDNPFNQLGMQAAFVLPLSLPVVGAATLYKPEWFYPAFMIVLGAHYLPFVTLYGMRVFYILAGILAGAGLMLALYIPLPPQAGAWITGAVLLVFAFLGRSVALRESGQGSTPA